MRRRHFLETITIPETDRLRVQLYLKGVRGRSSTVLLTQWTVVQERRRWRRWRFVAAGGSSKIDYPQARRHAKEWLRFIHTKRGEADGRNLA